MKYQSIIPSAESSQEYVRSIILLDGFSAMCFGIFYFILSGLADPLDYSIETKEAIIHQGETGALIGFIYLFFCCISFYYWNKGRMFWGYIMLGLALVHFSGTSYIYKFRNEFPFFALLFYYSLAANLFILIPLIFIRIISKFFAQNEKA